MPQPTSPLARYMRILEVLVSCPRGLTLTQIAQTVGLQASSTHRLVNSLCEIGMVDRRADSKTYVLGSRMERLCRLAVSPPSVIDMVDPELHELVREFSETAYLAQLKGTSVESIAIAMPNDGEMTYVQPGRVMPIHATASAKAILAHQEPDIIRQLLSQPLAKYTEDTTTAPQEIMQELEAIRSQGYAVCDNELDPGVLSFAVPVQGANSEVQYAIGISGFSQRMRTKPTKEVAASLRRASRVLAAKLQQFRTG